jgi:hypothetical protein
MTLQDLSFSDLSTLYEKFIQRWMHSKQLGINEEETAELRRRVDLLWAEQTRREDILFFQS